MTSLLIKYPEAVASTGIVLFPVHLKLMKIHYGHSNSFRFPTVTGSSLALNAKNSQKGDVKT